MPAMIDGQPQTTVGLGRWHFVLERIDGSERLEAVDTESYIHHDRLALLSVVRGLEALEQASLVRLVTTSRYVDRGLRFGLPNWRDTNYHWESFGLQKPIRNADLWRRVDVAMQFHEIKSRLLASPMLRVDAATEVASGDEFTTELAVPGMVAAPVLPAPAEMSASARLARKLMPKAVAYRLDRGHSAARSPRPARTQPQTSSNTRLQWWEMALNLGGPLADGNVPPTAACGA